jgi:phosphohistidine phosphatase
MKTLYVIRHGKSDWNQGVMDFDRPLNPRGKRDAPNMGKYLLNHHDTPDAVLSSTANRAISTARLLLHEMNFDISTIQERDNLYHASIEETLNEVATVSSDVNTLYIFGHNPGFSDIINYLSGIPTELKTCCVGILELQVDNWNELSRETCILKQYISPREI